MNFKKLAALFLTLAMTLALAACGGQTSQEAPSGSAGADGQKAAKIGVVLGTGGLGDKNFNDMAYDGLLKARPTWALPSTIWSPPASAIMSPICAACARLRNTTWSSAWAPT